MSHVILYSAVSSGEGGVKVALYKEDISSGVYIKHSNNGTYLFKVRQQALPTPARVTNLFPGIVVRRRATVKIHPVDC